MKLSAIQCKTGTWGKGIAGTCRNVGFRGIAGVISLLLAGCAGLPIGGVSVDSPQDVKQKAVLERARARWDAVLKADVTAAYGFLSPGSKAEYSMAVYGGYARFKGFKSVEVDSAECEQETCLVKVSGTLETRAPKVRERIIDIAFNVTETWVLENGRYWYVWRK